MICPGGPEVKYVFAGDSSLALVVMLDGQPSTRRNTGEYLKEKSDLLPGDNKMVWHAVKWGRRLPETITGVESSLEDAQAKRNLTPSRGRRLLQGE
eukprot:s990_g14.t1